MTQENAPRLTVIMPAYNAQKYIAASARSVLSQSFEDLELIVIDDGSRDNTAAVLAELAARDSRLRPVTVQNGGPAAARNRGIAEMRPGTEFVLFIDADDELSPGALDRALKGAESGAELVLFGYTIVDANGRETLYGEPEQLLSREALGEAFPRLYKANLLNQAWAKLYRADLLTGPEAPRFQDYRWGEDRLFVFDCLERVKTVCVLPQSGYRYVMHPGESLISRYYDKKFHVCLTADEKAEALAAAFGVTDQAALRYMFAKSVFSCITTLFSASCTLSGAEKRAVVKEILENDRVRRRCRDTAAGLPTESLCAVLRTGSVSLNLLAFRMVALAGEALPGLFIRLKHRK